MLSILKYILCYSIGADISPNPNENMKENKFSSLVRWLHNIGKHWLTMQTGVHSAIMKKKQKHAKNRTG